MYKIYEIKDTFRMPPESFGKKITGVAERILQEKYEGMLDKEMGLVLAVYNIRDISDGLIFPGDAGTRHDVTFDALTYIPKVEEIVVGEVTELMDFGAFVRIGPIDGLVHVSQITDDFISLDRKLSAFVSKRGGKSLKKGDIVYAKVSTVSIKSKNLRESRIALTMRPEGLGKPEWAAAAARKQQGGHGSGGSGGSGKRGGSKRGR
ncbi:MAG: DNA-directed RNA polymerase [Candidatus Marsarchaeota archaeon]|jgi:DNA-directed RNA polymerase subunit E'|nr:DNA-directed RNA polymerase [Candidatus Marsarchaeota archaeon]